MFRIVKATTIASLIVCGFSLTPASAISNGAADGTTHGNVACVLGQRDDGSFVGCGTGQLISPTVVLVAAHEFGVLTGLGATSYAVAFAPHVDPATSRLYHVARTAIDPAFNPVSLSGEDLGVLVLSERVRGFAPVELPRAGLLDEMQREGSLSTQSFTVVGYGVDCTATVPCPPHFDATRRAAGEAFNSLQSSSMKFQTNNAATGTGGICFGDSGSPHFLGNSNVSVGLTHLPTGNCNAAVSATRLDTPSARAFLGRFVQLPS